MSGQSIQCESCGGIFSSGEKTCPSCGAKNPQYVPQEPQQPAQQPAQPTAAGAPQERRKPQTIAELQQYCAARNMPQEKMRFFIGEDYRQPRAFGIYRDTDGSFVVYKNKADGTRAVRYRGPDEAHAVNELFEKLLSEIALREGKRQQTATGNTVPARQQKRKISLPSLIVLLAIIAAFAYTSIRSSGPKRGYYRYHEDTYYYQNNSWYLFDAMLGAWIQASPDDGLTEEYKTYYEGGSYDRSYGADDFRDSGYYVEDTNTDSNDSYDNWDDWDSGDTDWDSDW